MLNKIVLMGRLVRDPELRRTGSGTAVASFSLAVDRDFAPKDGTEKETDFIEIVAWRSTAEFAAKYFTKGQMAAVSGRLQIRSWQDEDGNRRRSAEVVADNLYFAGSKPGDNRQEREQRPELGGYNVPAKAPETDYSVMAGADPDFPFPMDMDQDELPF